MDYAAAVEYLDGHIGLGVRPGLERMRGFLEFMGDPQLSYPVIHVTGTNGKTSTVHMVTAIMRSHGLRVGTFTSPHLEVVEERFAYDGEHFTEAEFAQAMEDVATFADLFTERTGDQLTYFELTAALAMAAFVDRAIDVGVFEVGLGGRLDATNVVDSAVAAITGIAVEHTEFLGDTVNAIATEKAAILKPNSVLVTGDLPPGAEGPVTARVAEAGSAWRRWGTDYALEDASVAVGGWYCTVSGIYETYSDVLIPLHGRHQAHNWAVAVAISEEFFGRALDPASLEEAAAGLDLPGRLEVVGRRPLVVLDGAHNPQGAGALAHALVEDFPAKSWTLVVGAMGEKDVASILSQLTDVAGEVYAVAAGAERARPSGEVAKTAREALPDDIPVNDAGSVADGVSAALDAAGDNGAVIVTGSLYVVGEAKSMLRSA